MLTFKTGKMKKIKLKNIGKKQILKPTQTTSVKGGGNDAITVYGEEEQRKINGFCLEC